MSRSPELVRHEETGQSFAMKVVDRESVTTPIQVQQLFVERDILPFAENPVIASMAGSFELGFVANYVKGNDVTLTHTNICHYLYVYCHGSLCPRRPEL